MIFPKILRYGAVKKCCSRLRFNNYQKRCYSYEGDGKTSVTFLSRESDDLLMINSYNQYGFRLNSGIFVVGPVVIFPKSILSWNVAGDHDVNEDSLSLFYHLVPEVDVLVIGLGDENSFKNQTNFFNKFKALKQTNLNFELLTTEKAIATFNFLCIENRFVAAALIPPLKVNLSPRNLYMADFKKGLVGKDDYFLGYDVNEVEAQENEKYSKNVLSNNTKLLRRKFFSPLRNADRDQSKKDE